MSADPRQTFFHLRPLFLWNNRQKRSYVDGMHQEQAADRLAWNERLCGVFRIVQKGLGIVCQVVRNRCHHVIDELLRLGTLSRMVLVVVKSC